MEVIEAIRRCFDQDRLYYSRHARNEMREEELGRITDQEVYEAIASGEELEAYPDDVPYPSVLLMGRTSAGRPIHAVCAYSGGEDIAIVVTVYEPDPSRWHDLRRRRR